MGRQRYVWTCGQFQTVVCLWWVAMMLSEYVKGNGKENRRLLCLEGFKWLKGGGGKEGAHSLMRWCARLGLLLRLCLVDRATPSSSLVHLIAYIQEHNQQCSSYILHANSWHLSKSAVAWHLHSLLKICQNMPDADVQDVQMKNVLKAGRNSLLTNMKIHDLVIID